MNPRTTGILFLVAAALGAFVWLYEIRGEAGRKDAEAAAKRIFPGVEATAIDAVELATSDGQRARLERAEEHWRIAAPLEAQADEFAVDAIASALAQLASEAVYESPQPLDVYGLADESQDLRFRAGGAEHALRLGKRTPIGGNRYAFVPGRKPVYAVQAMSVNALAKTLDDLREKRVLRFDAGSVRRVTSRWPGGHVALARGDAGWQLVEPIAGPADRTTVEDLLNDLSFLRANGFVDAPTPEQRAALAAPELEVELELEPPAEGKEPRRLSLAIGGREGGEGDRLVRAAGPGLLRIASERLQDFPRDAASFRFREVSRFDLAAAEKLEIVFQPAGEAAVTVTATRGDEGWSATPEKVEPAKLATMIDELSRLRASRILADSMSEAELREKGLAPPAVRFRVLGGEGPLADVEIGALQGSDGVAARTAGVATVYLLAPTVADYLPVDLAALRGRFLEQPESAEAEAIGEQDEGAAELETEPANGPETAPATPRDADAGAD
jgi:hypothetical protein